MSCCAPLLPVSSLLSMLHRCFVGSRFAMQFNKLLTKADWSRLPKRHRNQYLAWSLGEFAVKDGGEQEPRSADAMSAQQQLAAQTPRQGRLAAAGCRLTSG